jgi:O-antigen ligase
MLAVIGTGAVMTVVALVQAASAHPTTIYGLWRPAWDWAVFGPYVNGNHFADYLAMATCLALGLLAQALSDLAATWQRRGRGWLTLGDHEGTRVVRSASVTLVLLVGLLASHSRGGLVALVGGLTAFTLLLRRRVLGALGAGLVLMAALYFVDLAPTLRAFRVRGTSLRLEIWADVLRAVPHFPLFGGGFNAYGTVSGDYRTSQGWAWIGEAHNDYLQVLVDTGLVGCAIIGTLLFLLARRALAAARRGPLDAGLAAALAACAIHNVVEFNWQIPANAATYVVLAGLIMRQGANVPTDHRRVPPAVGAARSGCGPAPG